MPVLLVVEAELAEQELFSALLEKFEYSAMFVHSAEEALRAVSNSELIFDAILMDLRSPHSNEVEAAGAIRQWERENARKTPLIAITACDSDWGNIDFNALGVDDCLSKPFQLENLRRVLLKWTYNPARPNLRILPPSKSLESA
jgi:CheY-like chemotaxis protein